MICIFILSSLLFAQHVNLISGQNYFDSPCPNIFQYQMDQNTNQIYGVVQVTGTSSNGILMNIELSVGNPVRGYNGMIELAKSRKEVITDVIFHRPVLYKVFFPVWQHIPPKVTKIFVNGNLVCRGPRILTAPVVTTINLQHTLRVDYQPLSFPNNAPSTNKILNPGEVINNPFFGQEVRPSSFIPDGRPPSNNRGPSLSFHMPPFGGPQTVPEEYPEEYPQFGSNKFNSNSEVTEENSNQSNNVNFRPQMPKDPSTILKRNPFLSSFTSKPLESNSPDVSKPVPDSSRPLNQPNLDVTNKNEFSTAAYQNICGRAVATNYLVLHGNSVPVGAYPWLAALFAVKDTGLNYLCSASLISNRHIVTAAHCVKRDNRRIRPEDFIVVLGRINIQKWTQTDGGKMIGPESIHIHPDYQPLSSDADIVVLILSEIVDFTKVIRPICLWNTETSDLQAVVGQLGTVVGWGKNENGDLITAEPKQIQLPIVSQETCLRSSYIFTDITSNRTFCAGFRNGSGPCNGDSGSGFIMKRGDRWLLRGIVSMSVSDTQKFTCDLKNYVVFTDASKFLDWLLSFLK